MAGPVVEIAHTRTLVCTKMFFVEVVIRLLPFLCDWLRTMTSKIMKLTKLFKDSLAIKFITSWIPFNTALPVITTKTSTVLAALTHDTLGIHARARTKLIGW